MYFVTFLAKNLLRRRTRTLLTVLGLVVAVAAVVAMMAVGNNIETAVERAFDTRRVDLIVQQAGRSTSDGKGEWSTVGVADNVIAASWEALADAYTYGLLRAGVEPAK